MYINIDINILLYTNTNSQQSARNTRYICSTYFISVGTTVISGAVCDTVWKMFRARCIFQTDLCQLKKHRSHVTNSERTKELLLKYTISTFLMPRCIYKRTHEFWSD